MELTGMDIRIKEMAKEIGALLKELETKRLELDPLNNSKLDELYRIYYRMQEYLDKLE